MRVLSIIFLVINALFLAIVLRQCSIVHGDGPGGFGEFILKGLLAHVSIASFGCLAFSLYRLSKKAKGRIGVFFIALAASTVLFLAFSLSGFYPDITDTSVKPHHGAGGVSCNSEGSTAKSSSVRRLD